MGPTSGCIAKIDTAAFLPPTEYAHASLDIDELLPPCPEYPPDYGKPDPMPMEPIERLPLMTWHRQVLFVKDAGPEGAELLRRSRRLRRQADQAHRRQLLVPGHRHDARRATCSTSTGNCRSTWTCSSTAPASCQPELGEFRHVQQPYGRMTGDDLKYYPERKAAGEAAPAAAEAAGRARAISWCSIRV